MRLIPLEEENVFSRERHILKTPQAPWTTYVDEVLSFDHPTGSDLKLIIQKPGDSFPIDGGVVTTAENSFFRAYRLTKDDKTLFLLMLDRRSDFDDGICFCGPIAFEKYAQHNGALFRFSYLEDGRVKKVQALNNEYRIECFEWTHMPIPQDDYFRIAQSVRFKVPEVTPQKRREAVLAGRDFRTKLGFLERGMTRDAVVSLLGKPVAEDDGAVNYAYEPQKLMRLHVRVPLVRGRFQGFDKESFRHERIPSERGTLDWMAEILERESSGTGSPFEVGPPKPLAKTDVKLIFNRFVELAPTANSQDWANLCRHIHVLQECGHIDPRVGPIVKARFCDMTLNQNSAGCYLSDLGCDASRELFFRRAKLILEATRSVPKQTNLSWGPFDDFHNLIVRLPKDSSEKLGIIREALAHPHPGIFQDALNFYEELPTDEALNHLRRAVSDVDTDNRSTAASAFAENSGSAEDLPLLRKQLADEKEKDIREILTKAIARLEKTIVSQAGTSGASGA